MSADGDGALNVVSWAVYLTAAICAGVVLALALAGGLS